MHSAVLKGTRVREKMYKQIRAFRKEKQYSQIIDNYETHKEPRYQLEKAYAHWHLKEPEKARDAWYSVVESPESSFEESRVAIRNLFTTELFEIRPVEGSTELPPLLITMTTCKRVSLFLRTFNSLMVLLGRNHPHSILIVDDGSSTEDQIVMEDAVRKYFPENQAEFCWKSRENKGHGRSMNIIREKVLASQCEFFFHLEDDFEFFWNPQPSIIAQCIAVLKENPYYGQCLFNNGYKEGLNEASWSSFGLPLQTRHGVRFFEHIFKTGINACSYWSHFSLRPGIFRSKILKDVGGFVETGFFEKDYGIRYVERGWKTAYLESVYCEHIGRKTADRFDPTVNNAYSLNQTSQFGGYQVQSWLIHLERRPDRMERLSLPDGGTYITVFPAVDGTTLTPSPILNTLFRENKVDMSPGVVGCALSHLSLWSSLIDCYKKTQAFLIFEDDAQFCSNFTARINSILGYLAASFFSWDIIFIGHTARGKAPDLETRENYIDYTSPEEWFIPRTAEESLSYSLGGTVGYLIHYEGARKLFKFIQQYGMVNAIDTVMQRCIDAGLRVRYLTTPLVCFSDETSSDIQGHSYPTLYNPQTHSERVPWESVLEFIRQINHNESRSSMCKAS